MADDQDIMSPADLGHKLVTALRSVSDPQAVMQAIADRSASNLRNEIFTKVASMDKATQLWHEDLVRVPTEVQRAVSSVREFLEQYIMRISAELHGEVGNYSAQLRGEHSTLAEVSEERFKSIQTQFTLLKQATEQLDLANKTAIAAALQAQKESAGETQKSSQAAIAKSETSTSEAIKALTASFNTAIAGITDRYNDLKGRMDRGEGKTDYSDPEMTAKMAMIVNQIGALSSSEREGRGRREASKDYTSTIIAIAAVGVATFALFFHQAPPPTQANTTLTGQLQADTAQTMRQLLDMNNSLIQRLPGGKTGN